MKIQRNFRQATAILGADLHLLEKGQNPPCRLDDYFVTQFEKIRQIRSLQILHRCPFIIAGDIFDHWKPSPELINACYQAFPRCNFAVAGNHDLPQHNVDLLEKSGFQTLCNNGLVELLTSQVSWNTFSKDTYKYFKYGKALDGFTRKIAVAHILTWKDEKPYPGCKEPSVDAVFDMFPEADLIVTGDNHKTFSARKGEQLLINPGSLMRRRGSQMEHCPCVFLWFSETNTYQIHYLKIDKDVVTRKYLDDEKELRENKELFLGRLDKEWSSDFSFYDNIERAVENNQLSKSLRKYVYKWMGV